MTDRMTDRVTDRGTLDIYMINITFAERNSEAAMGKMGSRTGWRPEYRPEGKHFVSGQFFIFGDAAKLRWAGGGVQRPVWGGNELKKTGACSARARTCGQNPLVFKYCSSFPPSPRPQGDGQGC